MFNYNNTNQNFANSNVTLDQNSTLVNEGNTVLNNLEVTNLTQGGVPINGINIMDATITGDGTTTTFPLGFTPITGDKYTFILNEYNLGLKLPQYTVTGSNITFSTAPEAGLNIEVRSFVSMGVLAP
jgi:hypothetical protein